MIPVSVVINTLNEAANLPGCLESLSWSDDVVVVDMQSDDRTAAIAAASGCRVFQHERMGYVEPARNYAISQAKNDWVLVVDADERASSGLAKWIQTDLEKATQVGFRIPRRNFYRDQWLRCCGWFPDEQLRLYRRDKVRYSDRIHRAPTIDGDILTLPLNGEAYLKHHVFDSWHSRLEKDNLYSAIAAKAMFEEGRRIGAAGLMGRTVFAFLSAYFMQGGIWNGGLGVALAWERAFATYMKYLKLWELKQNQPVKQWKRVAIENTK